MKVVKLTLGRNRKSIAKLGGGDTDKYSQGNLKISTKKP
jgi:hypothetical protein